MLLKSDSPHVNVSHQTEDNIIYLITVNGDMQTVSCNGMKHGKNNCFLVPIIVMLATTANNMLLATTANNMFTFNMCD